MTTPNQPNDERHQTNGVTERIAPSPIPPRPIPRPVASAENGQPGGGQQSGQPVGHPGGGQAGGHPGGAQPGGHPGQPNGPQSGGHPGGQPGNQPGGNQPNAQQREFREQQGDFAPQQGAPQQGAPDPAPGGDGQERFDQKTTRINNQAPQSAPETEDKQPVGAAGNGGQQSPYQDGWAQLPQREPQSNLYRPGQAPVTGRPNSGGGGLGGGTSNARTTADLAAKAARKEAAMVKSVGIDGPTRSIARPELIKDMPDLSEIRHPLPPNEAGVPQAGPVSPAVPVAVAAVASGEPLRATVQIRRIDPWSTLKISLVISVAMFFVWMLAVGLLYIVLEGMGVWERLNNTFTDMVSQDSGSVGLIDAGTVFGYAGVIGLINVVLFTALGTVGTFIYNQCCDLVGGIQVTLADPD